MKWKRLFITIIFHFKKQTQFVPYNIVESDMGLVRCGVPYCKLYGKR